LAGFVCVLAALSFSATPLFGQKLPPPAPAPQPDSAPQAAQRVHKDKPQLREEWFYEQRAFPLKQIPPGAHVRAVQRLEEMRRAERERGAQFPRREAITASQTMWTSIGPQPSDSGATVFGLTSGRIGAIAVDPTNPDIVYLGGAQGGVWKTTDGGVNWTPLTDDQPSLAIGALAIDPTSCSPAPCRIIYAGTGEQTFSSSSYYGAGILKSTDAGATWTHLPGPFLGPFSAGFSPGGGARISSLAVNRQNPNVILAGVLIFISADGGASSGIYRSTDGGVSWTLVRSGAAGTEVFFDPANPMIAYAALGTPCLASASGTCTDFDADNGIYRSMNMGATWTKIAGPGVTGTGMGFPTTNVGRIELAIAPSNSNTFYASVADASVSSNNLLGVFRTIDGGGNWTQLTSAPNFCTPQCWYDQVIRVHPNNANVVYAGGSATSSFLTRSTDGGSSWTSFIRDSTGAFVHVDQHAMAFGFNGPTAVRLYIGNDGGVWSTDVSNPTGTINWINLNNSLSLTQHYPALSFHPANENIAIVGSQDNDTHLYSGQLRWRQIGPGCDGAWTVIDPAIPSTWFITCQFVNVFRSLQDGAPGTFTIADDDIFNSGDRVAFIPPFVVDPTLTNRLYFGTFRVWQTVNRGDSWQPISPDLTGGGSGTIRAIAPAPNNPSRVFVGSSTGLIHRTYLAGTGTDIPWDNVTRPELPQRVVTQLAVNPRNPSDVIATFSGFGTCSGCDGKGHVFRSTNDALTWQDISGLGPGRLPDTPVNDIVIDPNDPTGNTLYIGTDVGVFFTTDGGVNWSTLVDGLPRVAVFSLKLRQASRTLRASTHGRGTWDLELPGLPAYHLRSILPTTASAGTTTDVTLTVTGSGFTASSVVQWNGMDLATTPDMMNPSTVLSATVPAAMLASAGLARVRVRDPVQGATAELPFTVVGPPPTLSAVSPNSAAQGSSAMLITVSGTNFVSNAVVRFNGRDLTTFFIGPTQLQATVFASDLATGGVYPVLVFNPPPGGGTSASQPFTVTAPPPPNDNFANAISVTGNQFTDSQNNVSASVEAADPMPSCVAGLPALADGGRARSIWYRFTAPANASVTANTSGSAYDTILTVVTGSPGAFTQVACDDDGVAAGGASRVTFTASAGVTYFFMVSAFVGDGGTTVFTASIATPPPNDNFAARTVVGTIPFSDAVNNAAATTENLDPAPSCVAGVPGLVNNGRSRSIWYRYTASGSGLIDADTRGSDYDTILSAFTGTPGAFTQVACNDDSIGLQSSITFDVSGGTAVYFMVTAFDGTGGTSGFAVRGPGIQPDFDLAASPDTISLTRGQTGTTMVTASAFNGFSSAVTLTCSGTPFLSTCSLNPTTVTPGASPSAMLTITTSAGGFGPRPSPLIPPLAGLWWLMAPLAMMALVIWKNKPGSWRWVGASVLLLVVMLTLLQVACGGGGGGGSSPPPPPPPPGGTPPGTYTITVTGTSGNLTRTVRVTLTVN
jgi:photosystem II stability/assembly factor-like uncharacterized protein